MTWYYRINAPHDELEDDGNLWTITEEEAPA